MEAKELEIQKIENISTIKFYDLMNLSNRDNLQKHVLGLLVIYDGFHILNYCQLDPEFESYFYKVKNQYLLEKESKKIEIDQKSEDILNSQILPSDSTSSLFYLDKKSEAYEHIVKNDKEINSIFQLFFYHLSFIMKLLGKEIQFSDIQGYRKNWNLEIIEQEKLKNLSVHFQKDNHFHYQIKVANVFDQFSNLELEISFKPESISVYWNIDRLAFSGFFEYAINSQKGITEEISASIDNKLVFYKKEPISILPSIPEKIGQYIQLDGDFDENKFHVIKFPWQAYYLFSDSKKEIDENYLSHYIHAIYFEEGKEQINIKEHSNVMIECLNSKLVKSLPIDGVLKNTDIFFISDRKRKFGVLETTFEDVIQTSGEYKGKLAGRTFYHVCKIDKNGIGPAIPITDSIEDYELTDGKALIKQFKGEL